MGVGGEGVDCRTNEGSSKIGRAVKCIFVQHASVMVLVLLYLICLATVQFLCLVPFQLVRGRAAV